jgi:hypothetical protein
MDGCRRQPRIFVELFLKTTDFLNHMENCCGSLVGWGRIGKNVLPEEIRTLDFNNSNNNKSRK